MRQNRKRQKLLEREQEMAHLDKVLTKIRAVSESLKGSKKRVPIGPVPGQYYQLSWSNHPGQLYDDNDDRLPGNLVCGVRFYHPDEEADRSEAEKSNIPDGADQPVHGYVLSYDDDRNFQFHFGVFFLPAKASRKSIVCENLDDYEGHEVSLKFLGSDCLKFRLPKELMEALMPDDIPLDDDEPEEFEYVGVLYDMEKKCTHWEEG